MAQPKPPSFVTYPMRRALVAGVMEIGVNGCGAVLIESDGDSVKRKIDVFHIDGCLLKDRIMKGDWPNVNINLAEKFVRLSYHHRRVSTTL